MLVSVLKIFFFAQTHSNLKDNNRDGKAFLTERLLSLLLVSQAVIHTVFISAAEVPLYDCSYSNSGTKIGHLCCFISQKAEIGHRCSHLNLAFWNSFYYITAKSLYVYHHIRIEITFSPI